MTVRTVAVVGAGNMGRGLVRRLTSAGHTVLLADHDLDKARDVVAEAARGQRGAATTVPMAEAMTAEIVVIALWYPGTVELATAHRDALAGKIVVDISNPLDSTFTQLSLPPTTSGAEELASALPSSRVVKAFNTVPAPTLFAGVVEEQSLDSFVASDDAEAKETVLEMLTGTGLRGVDAGALGNSRLLERLTAFGIELGQRYGLGFEFGFKFLPSSLPLAVKD